MLGARRRVGFAALALLALAGALVAGPGRAGAQEPTAAGAAFALSVASASAFLVPPTPPGVAGAGPGGYAAVQAAMPTVALPGVASVAGLRAATDGTPAAGGTARVASQAAVDGLSVAGGLVSAGAVSSTCTSTGSGSAASAVVTSLQAAGTALPTAPPPNTAVEVPGVLRGVLNEQVPDRGPGRSGITVRGVHVLVQVGEPGMELLDLVVAESRCLVTTGTVVPPGSTTPTVVPTTRPPRTTTSTVRTTTTATTRPPATTTTASPTPTAPATSSVPPTTAAAGQAVAVEAAGGRAAGPGGSEVTVAASGFQSCADVQIHFDDRRIGVAHPDQAGRFSEHGLSVPGDAGDGNHVVTASCRSSGRLLRATAVFQVVAVRGAHRRAFVTSLAQPDQVGTNARSLLLSAVGALGLILAVAFPSQLFNSTLDENYDEVRGWFGFHRPHDDESRRHQIVEFVGFVLLGGLLYGFLSPDLGLDRSSAALVLGLSLSLVVISLGFRLPHLLYVHHRDGEWAKLRVLPGTALVAVVCVALSRLVHFQPGYLYGLIAGLAIRRQLAAETNGALTAVSALAVFALSIAAWLARAPVSAAAARPGAGIWLVALEACLAAVCILGIETVVICLIPLRFVEGSKLEAWSRTAWAVVFGLAAFGFVHILLRPDSGYVAASSSRATVVVLFLAFGAVSIGFWAYFRFRPARVAPAG